VGRDRTHSRTVFSHPPRCDRTCGFHRIRPPPGGTFRWGRVHRHSPSSRRIIRLMATATTTTLWPFPLWTAFPSSEYYGHADSLLTHRRIWSGLPHSYFRSPCHRQKGLPCSQWWTQTRSRRWRLSVQPIPTIVGASVDTGYIRSVRTILLQLDEIGLHRSAKCDYYSLPTH
jgi:hypothetical protein